METVEIHLAAAENELRQGHARAALLETQAALRLDPRCARALALEGLAHVLMGDGPEARDALSDAAEIAPRDSRVRYHYYLALGKLGDREGARAQLTYFCQLEPDNVQARGLLTQLGGAVMGLPPLAQPQADVAWFDAGGHALASAADVGEEGEPPPGPGVIVCPECERRTWKGIVCKHCGALLPKVGSEAGG